MPSIKSAKKRARQEITRRARNTSRKTAVKTAVKKVIAAVVDEELVMAKDLLREAESKIARAKTKGVMHPKTAARKISRLAKRVAAIEKAQSLPGKAE
jgi:small subunit ribosomal protein S20